VYYYSWTGSLIRFLIPMMPFFALIAAGIVGFVLVKDRADEQT
jgi:hypothetical protein